MSADKYVLDDWQVSEEAFDRDRVLTSGSITMSGNGYLGYRGTFPDWRKEEYVGCIVSDTYDNADGTWTELCNVPNGLYVSVSWKGEPVAIGTGTVSGYSHSLDFRYGITKGMYLWGNEQGEKVSLSFERFASYRDIHLVLQRTTVLPRCDGSMELTNGMDGDMWSLNGDHFSTMRFGEKAGLLVAEARTADTNLGIVVASAAVLPEPKGGYLLPQRRGIYRVVQLKAKAGQPVVLETTMSVYTENDTSQPEAAALAGAIRALESGFEGEKEEHRKKWRIHWNRYDIRIEGDEEAQSLIRYNIYHNVIATPAHTDHLPIGARGLSCQAYQGAAFWDQEIFNLPMFIYTDPRIARNTLTYRHKTLSGARRKAAALGYRGAFYAWTSGKSGQELCPSYFFKDVLTGRRIRNHFNDWQIHISPDIAYALWKYCEATDDWLFMYESGAEILFEVARFLYSYACHKPAKQRYEIIRVIGPDEYHENVDDNVFNSVQARFALEKAVEVYDRMRGQSPARLQAVAAEIGLEPREVEIWRDMAHRLYIPQPDPQTRLLEQFDGYFSLEDVTPQELEKRLLDAEEYWGGPNGVAVGTQVIKQADVVQLFVLHNYPSDVVETNFLYYEPRTHHGSSLSPGVHSLVAARTGRLGKAYKYFLQSCTIDLCDTNPLKTGGTFIGGIHTAACGMAWQMVVFGFLGMSVHSATLRFEPQLPRHWKALRCSIVYRGHRLGVLTDHEALSIASLDKEAPAIPISTSKAGAVLAGGETIELQL